MSQAPRLRGTGPGQPRTGLVGAGILLGLAGLLVLGGCARGGGQSVVPSTVMDVTLTYAGPINDAYYYFIPIDTDNDISDGPIPVASGPYWGNGWGAGSYSYYVEYHQGAYQLYRQVVSADFRQAGGGIIGATGNPVKTDTGTTTLTVGAVTLGAATVSGAGTITAATNSSDQNAGTLTVATDGAGAVEAGSVAFTPAADGGRALTSAETSQLATVNAGGAALATDTFAFLGLTLQLGAPTAASQTITVAPTTAQVTASFLGDSPPQQASTTTGTVTANSDTATATPPIPGVALQTGALQTGGQALLQIVAAQGGQLIGPPYDYTLPNGSNTLRVTLDLSQIAADIQYLSLNFISTTQLIFDPNATQRDHVYDALGPLGNDYIALRIGEYGTYQNGQGFLQEGANDATLQYAANDQQKASVDLTDWTVTIRRL